MKKTQFKIGLLTACLVSLGSVANAQSCGAESCDSKACNCSKKHCDDKGLLEVINNAASNFEARLANMIPDRDAQCTKAATAKSRCTCAKCNGDSAHYTAVAPKIVAPEAQSDFVRPPMPRMKTPPNPIVDPVPAPRPSEVVPVPNLAIIPLRTIQRLAIYVPFQLVLQVTCALAT